jgi:hypothetical protein
MIRFPISSFIRELYSAFKQNSQRLKHKLQKRGGQFAPEYPGHFEPGMGGHFKSESGGQFERNLHIGHFNQKGALGWEEINSFNEKVDSWDWNEIKKTSGKLKYFIDKKLAVKKQRSYGVLRGAEQLENQGITLIH